MAFDADEMAALVASLRARGQQVPIEVVAREAKGTGRNGYGLISGLRRVMALREIGAAEVLALVRRPETSSEAYLAMVEENEIRGRHFLLRTRARWRPRRPGSASIPTLRRRSRRCFPPRVPPSAPRSAPSCGCMRRLGMRCATRLRSPNGWALRWPRPSTGTGRRRRGWRRRLEDAMPTDSGAERAVLEKALSEGPKTGSKPRNRVETPREIVKGVKIEAPAGQGGPVRRRGDRGAQPRSRGLAHRARLRLL